MFERNRQEETQQETTVNALMNREKWQERRNRLFLLVGFRIVIITALLISTIVAHANSTNVQVTATLLPLYMVAGLDYLASIFYTLCFKFNMPLILQTVLQMGGDLLFAAAIMYLTGGVQSVFTFFYLLAAINGAVILPRKGAMWMAAVTAIIFVLELCAQYYGFLVPYAAFSGGSVTNLSYVNTGVIHTFGIFAAAFLTTFLSEQATHAHHTAVVTGYDLSQLKELHLAVVQNMPVGVVTLDSHEKVVFINSLAGPMLSGEPIAIGSTLHEIFGQPLNNYAAGLIVNSKSAKNEQIALLVQFTPLTQQEHILGNILTLQDVTLVRQMERQLHQQERLVALGEMSAGIAHEIRNPLASIRGSIEMLSQRTAQNEAEQGLMNIAMREIDRLNGLVTDFLTYTRRPKLVLEPCDVVKLCKETVVLLQVNLPADIIISLTAPNRSVLDADSDQLRQVFWNLLKNSVEACQEAAAKNAGQNYAINVSIKDNITDIFIKFSDNGPGIAPEEQAKIFVPFFSTKSQGSGLGLAIIQRIIEDHHGTISFTSEVGQGTSFSIILPRFSAGDTNAIGV